MALVHLSGSFIKIIPGLNGGLLCRAGIRGRTAGSYMAIEGISPTIIGKALGHRSPQATAVYARLTQDPVRQALELAQQALTKPTNQTPSKVVKMPSQDPNSQSRNNRTKKSKRNSGKVVL